MHLYGLDLYNNPAATNAARGAIIAKNYLATFAARCARIVPAFGFGGVANKYLTKEFKNW
jgi:hypothetical protein